jgi:hypothetical protein
MSAGLQEQGWSINVKAVDVLPETDALNPGHLAISIRDPAGKEVLQFNGGAMDENSKIQAFTPADGSKLTAYAAVHDRPGDYVASGPELMDEEIFVGSLQDVLARADLMAQGAKAINDSNQSYRAYDPVGQAQNSNSVAAALLKAAHLDMPDKAKDLWIPGTSTDILPEDWQAEQPGTDPQKTLEKIEQVRSSTIENPAPDAAITPPKPIVPGPAPE